jgi:hypothetical protein
MITKTIPFAAECARPIPAGYPLSSGMSVAGQWPTVTSPVAISRLHAAFAASVTDAAHATAKLRNANAAKPAAPPRGASS